MNKRKKKKQLKNLTMLKLREALHELLIRAYNGTTYEMDWDELLGELPSATIYKDTVAQMVELEAKNVL